MGSPTNHLLPTSLLLPPHKLTMRLRFEVAPTFCKMLERPLIPDSCRFKSRSLVAARYTSTEPDTLPCPAVNSSPTSVCVVCSHERPGFTKLPGRYPTAGWSPNE